MPCICVLGALEVADRGAHVVPHEGGQLSDDSSLKHGVALKETQQLSSISSIQISDKICDGSHQATLLILTHVIQNNLSNRLELVLGYDGSQASSKSAANGEARWAQEEAAQPSCSPSYEAALQGLPDGDCESLLVAEYGDDLQYIPIFDDHFCSSSAGLL